MGGPTLAAEDLADRLNQAYAHHCTTKYHDTNSHVSAPTAGRELNVAEWRQYVRHSARAGGSHELKDGSQVAGDETERHGAYDETTAEDEVQVHVERLVGKVVIEHDLTANKSFQW